MVPDYECGRRMVLSSFAYLAAPIELINFPRRRAIPRETDEWFWLCFRRAVNQHPALQNPETRKRVMDYCQLRYLSHAEAVRVLKDATKGRYELSVIPDRAISVEDKLMMKEDKQRLRQDLR